MKKKSLVSTQKKDMKLFILIELLMIMCSITSVCICQDDRETFKKKKKKAKTEQKMSWCCELRCGWHRALDSWGLRSRLIRWCQHAVTGRCILKLISAGGGAEVCSGMERFNNLKPNYACPGIALYAYIESTESANESSQFSWVNKKNLHRQYKFETLLFLTFLNVALLYCYVV